MTDADDAARRFGDAARAKELVSDAQLRKGVFDRETKRVLELMRARVAVLAPQLGKYRLRTTDRGAEVTTPEGDQLAALSLTAQEHTILHVCIHDEFGVEQCEDVQLWPSDGGKDLWAVSLKGTLDAGEFVEYYLGKLLDEATKSIE